MRRSILFLLVTGCIFFITLIVYIITFVTHDKLPKAVGKSKVKLSPDEYGFGPDRQLLVFEVDHEKIEMKDKIFSRVTVSNFKDGVLDKNDTYTAGIEIKGSGPSERRKLNYAFEIWEPLDESDDPAPCISIESCQDSKAELFDFGKDYEDYVLRGGYNEPTFVRDTLASKLKGGVLQTTLVEVLFKRSDGSYSYEGVYILYPAIQRRVLEKRLDWDNKGKAKCDDEPGIVDNSAMIGEFTIESRGRKAPCSEFDLDVKMRYPKCDMDKCFYDRLQHFFSVLTLKNETEVALNMDSFVDTYFTEMLMREDDFPYTSQYFYISPDDNVLNSGPRWDYDKEFWRVAPTYGWDLFNLNYYDRGPMELWVHLGKHQPFIDKVNSVRESVVDNNINVANDIIFQRRNELGQGYFDRNIERWNIFGKKPYSFSNHILYAVYGKKAGAKSTMEKELNRIEDYFHKRSAWMKSNPLKGYGVRKFNFTRTIIGYLSPLILTFVAFFIAAEYIIYKRLCRSNKQMEKGNSNELEMLVAKHNDPIDHIMF